MSIQYQQGFPSVLQRTSMSTLGDSLSVHQDTVEDPVVLAPILSLLVDKTLYRVIRKTSKNFSIKTTQTNKCFLSLKLIYFSVAIKNSDKGSGHGILEFSTDKAGQDVTPLNLEFDEPKQRSSTLNSITGEKNRVYSVDRFTFTPFFPHRSGVILFLCNSLSFSCLPLLTV